MSFSPDDALAAINRTDARGGTLSLHDDLQLFRVPKHRFRHGQSYAITHGGRTVLIDTVHAVTRTAVDRLLAGQPPAALLLTHADLAGQAFGNATALSDWLGGAPVLLHSMDIGNREGFHPLESNGPLLQSLGIDYYHIPGHTAGCCAYLHRPTGYFFAGDCIVGNNYERTGQFFSHPPLPERARKLNAAGWHQLPAGAVTAVFPLHGQPSWGADALENARTAGLDWDRVMKE